MRRGSVARRLALASRRVMLRTQGTPLRIVWRLAYLVAARAVIAYLRGGQSGVSAYMSGSLGRGDPIYGISDLDIVLILPADGQCPTREAVERRWERLRRALPTVADLLLYVAIHDQSEIDAVAEAPVLTHGLGTGARAGAATYVGNLRPHALGISQKPGPFGPFADWRRLSGPERLPRVAWDRQRLRLAAWLELQAWWAYVFRACVDPRGPRTAYLGLKMVSEPVRILVFLATGERHFKRVDALRRGAEVLPEHRGAIEWALALSRRLHRSPEPPLAEALPHLVALSGTIARRLESELAGAQTTAVRLAWGGEDELALVTGRGALRPLLGPRRALVPLVDWRAVVRPTMPDDAFALVDADPRDPTVLAAAAAASRQGPYLALSAGGLLILPTDDRGRTRLRAVQCALTDPVSFALAAGRPVASFPEAAGWSAVDWGRRAVAEHLARLARQSHPPGATLGLLLSAARAAFLLESVDGRQPELPLTAAAVSERLAEAEQGRRGVVDQALDSYLKWRCEGPEPPAAIAVALRELVLGLDAYAGGTR